MPLRLNIDPQQEGSLHHSALDAMYYAATASDLPEAERRLRERLNPASWGIYRCGHHLAIHWESGARRAAEGIRVATVEERA